MRRVAAAALLLLTAQSTPAVPPAAVPVAWVAKGSADLVVLDKVSARTAPLNVKVGGTGTYGPLSISVRGCYIRPPDAAADSTAYLDITDSTPGAPEFHAWMVASAPAVSAMQHPVYDVRIVACR